jgi:hypothetical protein
MFTSIFGTVVEIKQISTNDSLQRKKYIGVWRWVSELVVRMMSIFPSVVARYLENSPKRKSCNSGSSERPKRRNCDSPVWFSVFMEMVFFLRSKEKATFNQQSMETSIIYHFIISILR